MKDTFVDLEELGSLVAAEAPAKKRCNRMALTLSPSGDHGILSFVEPWARGTFSHGKSLGRRFRGSMRPARLPTRHWAINVNRLAQCFVADRPHETHSVHSFTVCLKLRARRPQPALQAACAISSRITLKLVLTRFHGHRKILLLSRFDVSGGVSRHQDAGRLQL